MEICHPIIIRRFDIRKALDSGKCGDSSLCCAYLSLQRETRSVLAFGKSSFFYRKASRFPLQGKTGRRGKGSHSHFGFPLGQQTQASNRPIYYLPLATLASRLSQRSGPASPPHLPNQPALSRFPLLESPNYYPYEG